MGLQRVRHDWVTELNRTERLCTHPSVKMAEVGSTEYISFLSSYPFDHTQLLRGTQQSWRGCSPPPASGTLSPAVDHRTAPSLDLQAPLLSEALKYCCSSDRSLKYIPDLVKTQTSVGYLTSLLRYRPRHLPYPNLNLAVRSDPNP